MFVAKEPVCAAQNLALPMPLVNCTGWRGVSHAVSTEYPRGFPAVLLL
jgi:hypothetical protein